MTNQNENPAVNEILSNAKKKISENISLTDVEKIILREYVLVLRARRSELQLKSQRQMLTDVEYSRLQGLDDEILKYGGKDEG